MNSPIADDGDLIETAGRIGRELATALSGEDVPQVWCDDAESYERLEMVLHHTLEQLSELNLWGVANRLPSSAFWDEAGHVLRDGDLLFHARSKPRGYAGDFEMLEKICNEQLCRHPLGRLLDRFFQRQHAPQAVRNRTRMISQQIVAGCRSKQGQPFHVVSIGSGPAVDVIWAAQQLDKSQRAQLFVTLIDLDPNALEHCQQKLAPLIVRENLELIRQNLYRLWRFESLPGRRSDADLIYCTGLFDYLDDKDAAGLLHTLARWVDRGQLLVFNFSPANPTRAFMEWVGNWYLTYRTESGLRDLAERAQLPTERVRFDAEPMGVNLFLEMRAT